EGHADERGTEAYNQRLGQRRAEAVKRFLTAAGVPASRLETASYGETRPLEPGHNERAWAANRRAEFRILSGPMQGAN
ncbi:MAG: OmpA family protein, partial [Gemmatimonadetes bacterium]|nr:OmpA family protein [Gemmatimonadota bacterium]